MKFTIKEAREAKGRSQKELAEAAGMSPQQLSQYENGLRNPKLETLIRIADALNVSIEALTDIEGIYQAGRISTGEYAIAQIKKYMRWLDEDAIGIILQSSAENKIDFPFELYGKLCQSNKSKAQDYMKYLLHTQEKEHSTDVDTDK